MKRKYCDDCGSILERSGICSNCMEELYIITYQGEDMEYPPSKEFEDRAVQQETERLKQVRDES